MMERTDVDGRWESPDDGVTWMLVEPSQTWLDAQAEEAANQPTPQPTAEERIAQLEAIIEALLEAP